MTGPYNGQLALGAESTYGTAATRDTFLPFLSDSVDVKYEDLMDPAVLADRLLPTAEQYQLGNKQVGGSISTHAYGIGLRKILTGLFGTETDPGSGSPRAFVYTPGDVADDSLTVELNAPSSANDEVRLVTGAQITGATFEYRQGQLVVVNFDIEGQDWSRSQSPTAATYAAVRAMKFVGATFSFTGMSNPIVKQATIRIDRGLATGRRTGTADTIRQPLQAKKMTVTCDMVLEFKDLVASNAHDNQTEIDVALSTTDGTNTLAWALHGFIKGGVAEKFNTRDNLLEHTATLHCHADSGGGSDSDAVTCTYTTSEGV